MARFTILVVDDEKILARSIRLFLEDLGYEADVAADGDEALQLLERRRPDLVFLDIRLPKVSGLDLLKRIRERDPSIGVVMMTAYGTIEGAVEAMKLGAVDYLTKPIDLDELKIVVERVEESSRLRQEVLYYRGKETRDLEFGGLIGGTRAMQEIFERIGHLASLEKEPPTVLLTGETGTGKSLFARALHMQSQRARRPFMEIGCTSLPPTLVETELFGYEKGSFTDARDSRIGLIEAAEGGTVLLDEVGDLDLSLQGKLLRAIDERTIRRIGSVRDRKVDAWILAATNKDLEAAVAQGAFRNDLYYRLAVVTLHLPPLRDRAADVAPLAAFFLKRFAAKYGKRISRLSEETVSVLGQYRWPGNIRELKHVIERAVLASRSETIGLEDITLGPADPSRSSSPSPDASLPPSQFPPEGIPLVQMERAMIERALKEAKGNQAKAARLLGLSRDTLRYRMAKFKIAP